jgi:hypothetical protein
VKFKPSIQIGRFGAAKTQITAEKIAIRTLHENKL